MAEADPDLNKRCVCMFSCAFLCKLMRNKTLKDLSVNLNASRILPKTTVFEGLLSLLLSATTLTRCTRNNNDAEPAGLLQSGGKSHPGTPSSCLANTKANKQKVTCDRRCRK